MRERQSECGCHGWECELCGKWCWSCKEGGADEYPEFCDDCWYFVVGDPRPGDEDSDEQLEAECIRIMRRLVRREPV